MKINKLFKFSTIAVIIAAAAFEIPAIAQTNSNQSPTTQQTPGSTTDTPNGTTDTPSDTTKPTGETQQTPSATGGNLLQVAESSGSFRTLAQAVEASGLANTLSDGSYTIFAPTDQAFTASLPEGALELLLRPENKDLLRQVLSYHVVPGRVTASKLRTGSVKTLGGSVAVRKTPQKVVINDASVTQSDIKANNGVIHAVNRVLLPRTLRQTIASKLSAPESNPTSPQQNPAPDSNPTSPQQNPVPEPNQTP